MTVIANVISLVGIGVGVGVGDGVGIGRKTSMVELDSPAIRSLGR